MPRMTSAGFARRQRATTARRGTAPTLLGCREQGTALPYGRYGHLGNGTPQLVTEHVLRKCLAAAPRLTVLLGRGPSSSKGTAAEPFSADYLGGGGTRQLWMAP